jgi:hypothetical protein
LRRFIASMALTAGSVLSIAAPVAAQSGPTRWVQCAVGYTGPEYVVMNYVTYESRAWVQDAGATCGAWIATGNWVGVDRYVDWEKELGLQWLCKVVFGPGNAVDVFALPYYKDRVIGYGRCELGRDLGGRVEYNDVGPARDFR